MYNQALITNNVYDITCATKIACDDTWHDIDLDDNMDVDMFCGSRVSSDMDDTRVANLTSTHQEPYFLPYQG